jgi:hypothetical protein
LNGWLVPTLPCIALEEKMLLERKRRACLLCVSSTSPFDPKSRRPCPHHPKLPLSLSSPGPQYLHFLETYGHEILYRAEQAQVAREEEEERRVAIGSVESDEGFGVNEGDLVIQYGRELSLDEIYQRELGNRVGMYCIRPFLAKLDNSAVTDKNLSGSGVAEGDTRQGEGGIVVKNKERGSVIASQIVQHWDALKAKSKRFQDRKGLELGCCFGRKKKKERLFGEVLSSELEKKKVVRVDETKKALAWYYGETGVLRCPPVEEDRLGKRGSLKKLSDGQHKRLGVWRKKLKVFGSRVVAVSGKAMVPLRYFTGFETL